MEEEILSIPAEESGERIDALLARTIEDLSRNAVQRLLEQGLVLYEGEPVGKSRRTRAGECYTVILPAAAELPLLPQALPLDIVYEDEDLVVVNKARGMVVHPAPGHPDGTLVNALLWHCGDSLSGIGGEKRPGIVHRIDKDTSGLLIAAKNDRAHLALSAQLSDHSLARVYEALVRGRLREESGTVDRPIGRHPTDRKRMAVDVKNGRPAVTHWEVLARYRGYTHVRCRLEPTCPPILPSCSPVSAPQSEGGTPMTTKQISRMVILTAVIVSLVVLLVKLIQGTAGIVGSLFNTVLGIVVVLALVIIVVWMFAYAKKSRKK